MRTITLEVQITEELANRWETLPVEERNHYAVAAADALTAAMEETYDEDESEEADPEVIGALQEGAAQLRVGHLLTPEEAEANFEAAFAVRAAKMSKASTHG